MRKMEHLQRELTIRKCQQCGGSHKIERLTKLNKKDGSCLWFYICPETYKPVGVLSVEGDRDM